jgi:DNA-binding PadR family transcriptional regulator
MKHHDWTSWASAPWGRRGRFFEPGEVRLAILSLLGEDPKHGYELMKAIESRSGGTYNMSAGTVYPTLQQLEDEGMIASEMKDGRRVYQLTDAGRAELEREGESVDEIWRRADRWKDWGPWTGPEAYAVAGPLGRLMKTTFQAIKRSRAEKNVVDGISQILERASHDIEEMERGAKHAN